MVFSISVGDSSCYYLSNWDWNQLTDFVGSKT